LASRHLQSRVGADAGRRIRPRFAADDRLVALVRAGDPTAFEILYDRHARELLSFCTYILGSRDDAEDAVQSTFASAYRALLADERDVNLRPWLFAIARNASLSFLRKRRPTAEIDDAEPGRDDPVAQAEQRENLRQVVSTMLELPEHQRAALVLAELHGLSHGEIGAVLGVRTERVKSYIYQARSSLVSERIARSADCLEIREELATARGPALLKSRLRRHLHSCEGCRDYAQQLSRQRGQLGILLPVLPSLALKRRILEAASSDATSAGACVGGGAAVGGSLAGMTAELAGTGGKALLAKVLVGLAGVGAAAGAGTVVASAGTVHTQSSVAHARLVARVASGPASSGDAGESPPTARLRAGRAIGSPGQPGQLSPGLVKRRSQLLPVDNSPIHGAGAVHGRSGEAHGKSAESHGKGEEAHGNGASHGKSAEAHGSGAIHGKSGEAHGRSGEAHGKGAEAHGNGPSHGKSAEARGNSAESHGKSAEAHGNGSESHGKSAEAHGNGSESHGKSAEVHGNGAQGGGESPTGSHGNSGGQGNPAQYGSAGGNGNGGGPPATPGEAGSPGSASSNGAGGGSSASTHGAPGGAAHEPSKGPKSH
jgi:RNA polymerase sigma factor (sigma-70 family)